MWVLVKRNESVNL